MNTIYSILNIVIIFLYRISRFIRFYLIDVNVFDIKIIRLLVSEKKRLESYLSSIRKFYVSKPSMDSLYFSVLSKISDINISLKKIYVRIINRIVLFFIIIYGIIYIIISLFS